LTIMRLFVTPSSVVWKAMNGGMSITTPTARTAAPTSGTA